MLPAALPVTSRETSGLDLRLAAPAAAAWIVAWQGRLLPPAALAAASLVMVLLALGLLWRAPSRRAIVIAAALGCAAAAGLVTALDGQARSSGPLVAAAKRQAAVTVDAVLLDDPRAVLTGRDSLAVRDLVVARVRVEAIEVAGRRYTVRQAVLVLSTDSSWLSRLPSQQVRVGGLLRPADRGDDVAAVLSTRDPPTWIDRPSAIQRAAGRLRSGLRDAVRPLPAAERGLLPGLVDGDVSGLDPSVRDAFRTTGLSHLTAVSGTNVAVVLAAALLLCGWLRVPLRARPVVAGVALLAFVVLARPSPSVLRAAVMGAVALLALGTGTRRQAMPALCTAVLVLVLLHPSLAAAPGFALSVLATAGLLVLAPRWRDQWSRRMPAWAAEALAVPAAAQLACTPVLVGVFGQLGLLAVPANLLAVPAVAPATVLGVAAALVAPLCLPLAQAIAWLGWLPTHWLVLIARTGARLPGAEVEVPSGWGGVVLVLFALAVGRAGLRSLPVRRAAAAASVGALLATIPLVVVKPGWPPPGWLLVSCDVGQGDGFVVRLGPREALVVDVGPDPERIDRCLRRLGIDRVPLLVLTHLHADHVEGVPGLLRGRQVAQVQTSPLDEPAGQLARLSRWLKARDIPLVRAAIGEVRVVGGVRWEVLDATARYGTGSDPNNSSVVLRLDTHGVRVLFAGDLEEESQREVRARGVDLRADVLKVPHHGSAKQDPEFLGDVQAKVALTPVGAGNPYGHPSPQTLRRLEQSGTRTYRSDTDGDVAIALRRGKVVAVGRGGEGVAPRGGSLAAHHAQPLALTSVAGTPQLGVPAEALTWCETPSPAGPPSQGLSRARAPPGYAVSASCPRVAR